jgi:predicted lipoprotein with Yx(FWY)xxD motif
MKQRSRAWALTATAMLLAGSLAACGSSTDGAGSTPAPTPSSAAPAPTGGGATSATMVATASTSLGTILVDGSGMTLYMYTKDTQGAGASTCEGECLAAWPALVGMPGAGTGVDAGKLGSFTRADGTTQASYNGWPLYFWVQDKVPGDTTGQGVNNVWYVLDAQGEPIK